MNDLRSTSVNRSKINLYFTRMRACYILNWSTTFSTHAFKKCTFAHLGLYGIVQYNVRG